MPRSWSHSRDFSRDHFSLGTHAANNWDVSKHDVRGHQYWFLRGQRPQGQSMHCVPGPDFSGQRVSPQSLSPHDLYFRYGFLPGSTCARAPGTAPPSCPYRPAAPSRAQLRWVEEAVLNWQRSPGSDWTGRERTDG